MLSKLVKLIPFMTDADLEKMRKSIKKKMKETSKDTNEAFQKSSELFGMRLGMHMKRAVSTFGKGMVGALKMTGALAAAQAGVNALQAPAQLYQGASGKIDQHLQKVSDINTLSQAAGVSSYDIVKLAQVFESAGLDMADMRKAIMEMTMLREQERKDPGSTNLDTRHMEGTSVDALINTIRGLNDLVKNGEKDKALGFWNQLLGSRSAGKSQKLITQDIDEAQQNTAIVKSGILRADFNEKIRSGAVLEDKQGALKSERSFDEMLSLLGLIDGRQLETQDVYERKKMKYENTNIEAGQFRWLAEYTEGLEKISQNATQVARKTFTEMTSIFTDLGKTSSAAVEPLKFVAETLKSLKNISEGISEKYMLEASFIDERAKKNAGYWKGESKEALDIYTTITDTFAITLKTVLAEFIKHNRGSRAGMNVDE
jgi:soluble cytochrome b562